MECGCSAIVTALLLREFGDLAWTGRIQATYAAMNAVVTLVWAYCDVETMRTYLRHRGAARDASKLADWSAYPGAINIDFRPPTPHAVVDNPASSKPLQVQAKELLQSLLESEGA